MTERTEMHSHPPYQSRVSKNRQWIFDVLLVLVLAAGALFRFTGVEWDGDQHLHPDERFLTMVETGISPVDKLSDYFNTETSTLNPKNRGYGFYVYGTLPLFLVRYVGEWVGMTGYNQINVVGRVLSGIFDLGTILFIYLIAKKLYRNGFMGLLAAVFSALAVLQIQLSHFFTVDNITNFFVYAAIYTAVHIAVGERTISQKSEATNSGHAFPDWVVKDWGTAITYVVFGLLYGMALASKVSVYALAVLLPVAAYIQYLNLPQEKRVASVAVLIRNLIIAGIVAFFTFRTFQPYAFAGPGFFGLRLDPNWIRSMKELSVIMKGDVDVPYALQWARRPLTFTVKNLVLWGMGIPLGVLSLVGLAWMTWRVVKGEWKQHILIWLWAVFVLVTQSLNFVKSMRYIITIYPALALIAAWTVISLFEKLSKGQPKPKSKSSNWKQILVSALLIFTIIFTAVWAAAFTTIYTKPVTRVAASEWIYDNVPGALNLQIHTSGGELITQPLAYQNSANISAVTPYRYVITADEDLQVTGVILQHVLQYSVSNQPHSLVMSISELGETDNPLGEGIVQSDYWGTTDTTGDKATITFAEPVSLAKGSQYIVTLSVEEPGAELIISGSLLLVTDQGLKFLPQPVFRLSSQTPFQKTFYPRESGELAEIKLFRVADLAATGMKSTLTLSVASQSNPDVILGKAKITDQFLTADDPRGEGITLNFNPPVTVEKNNGYILVLEVTGSAELGIYNNLTVIESSWDDALPVGLYGYNQFGVWDGIYGNHLNLELYWEDNAEKLNRLTTTLDQADSIFISSNRQWGTIPRVPERYPLTSEFYRALIGCPVDKDILWCYAVAEPGKFKGELGFELTAVFQNDPAIGSIKINDQLAEEAFTVYDHPKVLIFEKSPDFNADSVAQILGAVDLSNVVHMTPRQASNLNGSLWMTEAERLIQQAGGTWRELFPANSILNLYPWLAAVVWYLAVMLLGWLVYPISRLFFKGLADKGYGFSRLIGMLLLAYLVWLAGSAGIAYTRLTIFISLLILLAVSVTTALVKRDELAAEIKANRKRYLMIEGLFLALFLIDLGIRVVNPDLWHPWKGGEKPMDVSYFTAVLKSTIFPPYDPWFAGGFINYYYYGFVIVGVLVKLLGIQPAIVYNLIIPTLFAITGVGAYTIGWNLFARRKHQDGLIEIRDTRTAEKRSLLAGLAAALGVLIAGNLGTLKMFSQGFMKLAAPDGNIDGVGFFDSISWFFTGLVKFISGTQLHFGTGEWYWNPSRAIPGDVITEFPFFTFIYADLHAHMIALPITILALGWAMAILFRNWEVFSLKNPRSFIGLTMTLLFGGFIVATLRPANTWDLPTFFLFCAIVIFYSGYRYAGVPAELLPSASNWLRRSVFAGMMVAIFTAGVLLFYLPFTNKYGQAYGSIDVWKGDHTPLKSYLVHWGWQLFLISSWLVWETREWLAATPASVMRRIRPYFGYLQLVLALLFMVLILLTLLGISIGWIVGLLGVLALLLMLRTNQPDEKRLVLFMIGTGLLLTLFVELFALQGDLGRMNTVFKFYFQAWTLLSISAAASLMWLMPAVQTTWKATVANIWQAGLVVVLAGALLYPLTAAADKMRDRISDIAPMGLVGDTFMQTSTYYDQGVEMDLNQDYKAIQWMRANVLGSPVIVEANTVEYRWGNRFTIYTGLPSVLGWNWHQRQQRGFLDNDNINNRLNEITFFYQTTSQEEALAFLQRYHVRYIIVGQLERAYFGGPGLEKFTLFEGTHWREVFRFQDTVIYEVLN